MKREQFEKDGKLWERVEDTCSRCGGSGIFYVAVMNGHGVPAQPDGGTCYKCHGTGIEVTERRVLNDKEKAQRERAKERYAEKREQKLVAERQQRLIDANVRFTKENFGGESDIIYIIDLEDTYSIKEELKENGAKWNTAFKKWCFSTRPSNYPVIAVSVADVCRMDEDGYIVFEDAYMEIIDNMMTKVEKPESHHLGVVGEKIVFTNVKVVRENYIDTRFGTTIIYNMEDMNGNVIVWFASNGKLDQGKSYSMVATVKDHGDYQGVKQTIITRASKIVEVV